MNAKQQQLKDKASKFLMAIDTICNSSKVSAIDKEVLMDRIKDIYDFLLTNDFNEENITEKIEKPIEKHEKPVQLIEKLVGNIVKKEPKVEPKIEVPQEKKLEEKEPIKPIEEPVEKNEELSKDYQEIIAKNEEIIQPVKQEEKQEEKPTNNQEKIEQEIKQTEEKIKELHSQISDSKENIFNPSTSNSNSNETSSVLEYLHQKVIKDIPQKEEEETQKQQADLFSDNRPTSIADRFEEQNKSDLRTAVGVSEKFMFINDLFSGNIKEYADFINKLNDAKDVLESQQIIEQTKQRHKWATGSLAYTTLSNLIEKRFSK